MHIYNMYWIQVSVQLKSEKLIGKSMKIFSSETRQTWGIRWPQEVILVTVLLESKSIYDNEQFFLIQILVALWVFGFDNIGPQNENSLQY